MKTRSATFVLILLIALSAASSAPLNGTSRPLSRFHSWPQVTLWAWERPEDLRSAGPSIGIGFLAATVTISGADVRVAHRHQPLHVDAAAPIMAVVRIETSRTQPLAANASTASDLAATLAELRTASRASALQIDFDATTSERSFYVDLIRHTRATIGDTPLSITALASWCDGDNWLDALPAGSIDEAVPMLFRMGPFNDSLRTAGAENHLRSSACRSAVGVSTDEPISALNMHRRLYVFSPTAWSQFSIQRTASETSTWR